jgi:hypothetical protein
MQAIIDEWFKTLNYEKVRQDGVAVTLPQAEVLQVLGYLQASMAKTKDQTRIIGEMFEEIKALKCSLMCDVCLGQPLANGRRCMCNGTGYKTNGVDYLREQLYSANVALDSYKMLRMDVHKLDRELERIEKEKRDYDKAKQLEE